jgi:hypothetical protein
LVPPTNDAKIECDPDARAVVVNVATPPLGVTVPSVVVPSRNVTAAAGRAPEPLNVAVKVTDAPTVDGLRLDVSATVGVVGFTVCINTLDFAVL